MDVQFKIEDHEVECNVLEVWSQIYGIEIKTLVRNECTEDGLDKWIYLSAGTSQRKEKATTKRG